MAFLSPHPFKTKRYEKTFTACHVWGRAARARNFGISLSCSQGGISPSTRHRLNIYFASSLLNPLPNAALKATNLYSSEFTILASEATAHTLSLSHSLAHIHSYVIEEGICYLALCEPTYPPQLAFTYLDNVHKDFSEQHGQNIHRAQRPYHFIEFGEQFVCV